MFFHKFLNSSHPGLFKITPAPFLKIQKETYLIEKFKKWYKLDRYEFCIPPKPDFIGFKNKEKISIELTEIPKLTDSISIKMFNFRIKLNNILNYELKDLLDQLSLEVSIKDPFYNCFFEKHRLPKYENHYLKDFIKKTKSALSQKQEIYEDCYLLAQIKINFNKLDKIKIQNLYAEDSFEYYIREIEQSLFDKKNKNYKKHLQNEKLILLIFIEPISFRLSDLIEFLERQDLFFTDSRYFDEVYLFDDDNNFYLFKVNY